ncbi:ATP-binding cassette sub-family C member 2-like [Babylonia areolata]|uniref:ATP-binding cassette sub-family C member 2-like n=1 Tax=Babylonia areolata TaxID=304850 RepID=UPI003FD6B69F
MASSDFEAFCGGPLWNSSLLLDNTWPQFTDCFMHTVLIWLPCGFLFLFLPCYVTSVNRQELRGTAYPVTLVNGSKLLCCVTLAILAMIQLLLRTEGRHLSDTVAAYLGDAIRIAAYVSPSVRPLSL